MRKQYVYILTHERIPGLVKIGHTTTTSVDERVASINAGTGVPSPFCVYKVFECEQSLELEQEIHRKLEAFRYGKEFFEISPSLAIDIIEGAIDVTEYLVTLRDPSQVYDVSDPESLGKQIRENRTGAGLTLNELAGMTNVGVRFLSELERGKSTCQFDKVARVLQGLGMTLLLNTRRGNIHR